MRFSILSLALITGTALMPGLIQAQSNFAPNMLFGPELRMGGSYLGVGFVDIDADRAAALKLGDARGVEVTKVEQGSPAAAAGIKAGDVLLTYNGENILGAQQLVRMVQETPQGRKIRVEYWRDGKTQNVIVTLTAPRVRGLEDFPNDVVVSPEFSHLRTLVMPDIPNTLLVWKSPVLGIECEGVDSQLAQYFGVKQGVLVRSVRKGSAADKAGLKAGDVLTTIGGENVATPRDVTSFLRMHDSGKPITLALMRDHKELTLNIVPAENQQ
jgi:serine protease Do